MIILKAKAKRIFTVASKPACTLLLLPFPSPPEWASSFPCKLIWKREWSLKLAVKDSALGLSAFLCIELSCLQFQKWSSFFVRYIGVTAAVYWGQSACFLASVTAATLFRHAEVIQSLCPTPPAQLYVSWFNWSNSKVQNREKMKYIYNN